MYRLLALLLTITVTTVQAKTLSSDAISTAEYAAKAYQSEIVESLRKLVKHNTVAVDGVAIVDNPAHQAFKKELEQQSINLGLDFTDEGPLVIIGLGNSQQRLGIITHGDVQPVDPKKWRQSPFELDTTSEPGRLIGRGSEDDKGPIVSALYAMKAIKDKGLFLGKRIELYVYLGEESDWEPLKEYISKHSLPELNITLDANYPVVTAEKGWCRIKATFPTKKVTNEHRYISQFSGGFFVSQIPEDATAVINGADQSLLEQLQMRAKKHKTVQYNFQLNHAELTITARGRAAHSSTPEDGVNAISYLADLLAFQRWPNNASGALVNFLNDQIGTGIYGEKFGKIAYLDDFMGPMTVSPTVLANVDKGIELSINMRRPRGKSNEQLEREINLSLADWQQQNQLTLQDIDLYIGDPFVRDDAPQVDTLLGVFSHFTGIKNPRPVSIGGGTNSRLFPNAVSFGPAMPGVEYTGHSEHEFISMEQFVLNLKMYTAVLVELTK